MNSELDWLIGQSLAKVEKKDFSWFFAFSDAGSITTESFWRLLDLRRLVVADGDHDQLFGLKEPVDATKRVMEAVGAKKIISYSLSKICSDLILCFENKIELQFFNTSGGYESWRAEFDGIQIVSAGGGRLSKFNLVGQNWIYVTNS
jgi:hypothetical protein